MHQKTFLTLLVLFSFLSSTNAADPSVLAIYGEGVHSFYAGNFQQSYDYLSEVIEIGTDDPRVYYFRGLSALRLGSQKDADDDFTKGATFEAERGNTRTVSRALERIQGPDRLLLEQSRSKARLALAERQEPQLSSSRQSFYLVDDDTLVLGALKARRICQSQQLKSSQCQKTNRLKSTL